MQGQIRLSGSLMWNPWVDLVFICEGACTVDQGFLIANQLSTMYNRSNSSKNTKTFRNAIKQHHTGTIKPKFGQPNVIHRRKTGIIVH